MPEITTTVDGCLVINAAAQDDARDADLSVSAGWTEQADQNSPVPGDANGTSHVLATKIVESAGGSGTMTVTSFISDSWAYATISIAPA